MSLLLGRTFTLTARTVSRRQRLAPSALESWLVPAAERSFWHQSTRSAVGSKACAFAGSVLEFRKKKEEYTRKTTDLPFAAIRSAPFFSSSPRNSFLDGTGVQYLSSLARIKGKPNASPVSRTLYWGEQNYKNSFSYAPSRLRSNLTLNRRLAPEQVASDLARRALATWASNEYHNCIMSGGSRNRNHYQQNTLAFFSTNSKRGRSGIGKTKIPTPHSDELNQRPMNPEDVMNEINKKSKTVFLPAILSGLKTMLIFFWKLPMNLLYYVFHPSEVKESWNHMKTVIKHEIDHYWAGTKLLWADLKTARSLLRRTLLGSSLTRRERKQLLRTTSDLFRLVPFSMFLIIPLMEFALPFALKLFPNLLPSTFQDSLKAEENMKRELQSRIAMAKFFQETLEDLAKEQKQSATNLKKEIKESGEGENVEGSVVEMQEQSAASFLSFMEKARNGEIIPNDVIVRYAQNFKDDLTLDNMPRMQLINMCRYMGIPPYGSDAFLRFQLRHRMRSLQEDDQRILWEGIDSLTKMELREACQERGMRSTGLSKDAYKRALQQWLDLSVKQNVPTSLLIMSRTFFLQEDIYENDPDDGTKSLAGLADAISGLDKEVVNEVILDVATSQEKLSDPGVRKIKLEVLMKQNELIEQEQAEREEAAAKKKELAKKEAKKEKETSEEAPQIEFFDSEFAPPDAKKSDYQTGSLASPIATSDAETPDKIQKDSAKMDEDLSASEMEAISQLVSADPVSKERADLASIKAALQDEKSVEVSEAWIEQAEISDDASAIKGKGRSEQIMSAEKSHRIQSLHAKKSVEVPKSKEPEEKVLTREEATVSPPHDVEEDPVVARLKRRIESMVDKIEIQISDIEIKIGDRLHMLDRDMDGLLSVNEIAEVLQQVLKRKITHEEALEIAHQMDDNKDGVFTVQELITWVETNLLVKFVEEGRDADMDYIIEKKSTSEQLEQKEEDPKA